MEEQATTSSNKTMMVIAGVIGLVLLGGAALLLTQNTTKNATTDTQTQTSPAAQENATPSAAETTDSAMEEKVITVEGNNFAFIPTEIKVKKGQKVKVVFKNTQGFHDFVIDEFNAKTAQINGGQTAEVTFTADKAGSFEYYCSVGKHREMGMKGTLIVE